MSLVQNKTSKELVSVESPETAQSVHIRSIQVVYDNVRRKRPVTVEIKVNSEKAYRSRQYKPTDTIDCSVNIEFTLVSKVIVIVREHRQLHSDKIYEMTIPTTDDLIIKPMLVIKEPNGKKMSLQIQFETAGPFIDIIRRLVEESQKCMTNMKKFMENLGKACEVLNYVVNASEFASDIHPAAGAAVSVVTALYERCKEVKECHEAASSLMADVAAFLPFVNVPKGCTRSNLFNETVQKILKLFEKISRMIIEYSDNTAIGIFLRNQIDTVNSYKEELRQLKETFDWCIKTEVWQAVLQIEKHTEALLLDKLRPVMPAYYDREKTCFDGTRKETLQAIEDWSTSDSKLFWLYGSACSGKTTILHTVAQRFREQNRLAGCFFCDKSNANAKLRDAKRIMPTIACHFASWHAEYRTIVANVLEGQGNFDLHAGLQDQFDLLVGKPIALSLSSVHVPPKHRPLIIVLDALDECYESPRSRRYLAQIVKDIANVAPWLKVFVSSRNLPEFEVHFRDSGFQYIDISNPVVDLEYDVAVYVKFCLGNDDPNDRVGLYEFKAHQLLSRIRAAFLVLDSGLDVEFLDSMSGKAAVDNLFRITMENIVGKRESLVFDEEAMLTTRTVLSLIIRAGPEWSLTGDMILFCLQDDLPKFTAQTLNTVLAAIRPLLYRDNNGTIRTSFPTHMVRDYVDNQGSSGRFWVDPSKAHTNLARGCFHVLRMQLKFNICGLDSLHLKNEDSNVPCLSSEVEEKIPVSLRYSCLYWMDHILQSHDAESFHSSVKQLLFSAKALFWIEVLNLLGMLERGKEILLQCAGNFKEVDEIARDANELHGYISAFHNVIAVSTPHLYISALAWVLPDSVIVQHASAAFKGWQSPLSDKPPKRVSLANTSKGTFLQEADISLLKGDTRNISKARYTPDGSKIVTLLQRNELLQIWDAKSREAIGEPFACHVPAIRAIAYSRDGSRIASRCDDGKLRIWDAHTGALLIESQECHSDHTGSLLIESKHHTISQELTLAESFQTIEAIVNATDMISIHPYANATLQLASTLHKAVSHQVETDNKHVNLVHSMADTSIAYSPDGTRIVTGSDDKTLRIWDAQSGACVGEPLTGRNGSIYAVAYAPDGRRIVSGSGDGTLRIWDAQSGAQVGEPLKGHEGGIWAVAYAPDGSRVVSGSTDKTLRIWDAQSGTSIGAPLKGHNSWVMGVAFSPDGTRVVSGSADETLRMWNARSGEPVGEPLRGHSDRVRGVAYSPDGNVVVSGSDDETLRIWNAYTGKPIGEPFSGHESGVLSVACSPNGNEIASVSWDGTMRVWHAHNGACIKTMVLGESRWDPDVQCFITISTCQKKFLGHELTVAHTANPSTVPDDGWLRTLDGSLFLWVPPEHRRSICSGQVRIPNNDDGKLMYMDWAKIPHGKDWTKIMDVEGSDID